MSINFLQSKKLDAPCLPESVIWFNRLALFIIFFWFGLLKIIQLSPAEQLISHLHQVTIGEFISIDKFLMLLGVTECVIGILWLVPSFTKYAIVIFLAQMITTFLPLIILPEEVWDNILVLSLSGQYILKNVVLVASAFTIYTNCRVSGWKLFS